MLVSLSEGKCSPCKLVFSAVCLNFEPANSSCFINLKLGILMPFIWKKYSCLTWESIGTGGRGTRWIRRRPRLYVIVLHLWALEVVSVQTTDGGGGTRIGSSGGEPRRCYLWCPAAKISSIVVTCELITLHHTHTPCGWCAVCTGAKQVLFLDSIHMMTWKGKRFG